MSNSQAAAPSRASVGARVQHLVLRVRDLEKSHDFYTRILGYEQCGNLAGFDPIQMRFYRGSADSHHDFALAQLLGAEAAPPVETPWQMFGVTPGIDHIAMCYPSRDAWLSQLQWMKSQGVEFLVRINHGMTHSAYIADQLNSMTPNSRRRCVTSGFGDSPTSCSTTRVTPKYERGFSAAFSHGSL